MRCLGVLPLLDPADAAGRVPLFSARLRGRPLFRHALDRLLACDVPVVVTVPEGIDVGPLPRAARLLVTPAGYAEALTAVLAAAPEATTFVVHDPAHPFTPAQLIAQALDRAEAAPQALVSTTRAVADTVKTFDGRFVGATIPRDDLESVHAPLVVPRPLLTRVLDSSGAAPASLVELRAALVPLAPAVIRVGGSPVSQAATQPGDRVLLDCAAAVVAH